MSDEERGIVPSVEGCVCDRGTGFQGDYSGVWGDVNWGDREAGDVQAYARGITHHRVARDGRMSRQHKEYFLALYSPNVDGQAEFKAAADESLRAQQSIESKDRMSFDQYLAEYAAP